MSTIGVRSMLITFGTLWLSTSRWKWIRAWERRRKCSSRWFGSIARSCTWRTVLSDHTISSFSSRTDWSEPSTRRRSTTTTCARCGTSGSKPSLPRPPCPKASRTPRHSNGPFRSSQPIMISPGSIRWRSWSRNFLNGGSIGVCYATRLPSSNGGGSSGSSQ